MQVLWPPMQDNSTSLRPNPMQNEATKAKAKATRLRNRVAFEALQLQEDQKAEQTKILRAQLGLKVAASIADRTREDPSEQRAHNLGLDLMSHALTDTCLLREHEIVAAAHPVVKHSGVYFLISAKRIIYVGQSTQVPVRVASHTRDKSFDAYAYIPCEPRRLDAMESLYIHFLQPELNGHSYGAKGAITGKAAPLTLSELLREAM